MRNFRLQLNNLFIRCICRILIILYRSSTQSWNSEIKLNTFRRVLLIRMDAIGDNVMNIPFLRELRRNIPNAEITLVTSSDAYPLIKNCPYVNSVYFVPKVNWHRKKTGGLQFSALMDVWAVLSFVKQSRFERFDAVFVPRWGVYSAATLYLMIACRAKYRFGMSEYNDPAKRRFNKGMDRWMSFSFKASGVEHEVIRNLQFLKALGGEVISEKQELWISESDQVWAQSVLCDWKGKFPIIAVCMGASQKHREWPVENYINVCRKLIQSHSGRFILIGGCADEKQARAFTQEIEPQLVLNFVGKISLLQSSALLNLADLYLGSDTGPMHIAAAAETPVVEISAHALNADPAGAHSPQRFGPWGVPSVILMAPVADICSVSEKDVFHGSVKLLTDFFGKKCLSSDSRTNMC